MENIIETIKYFKESDLINRSININKTIENEAKKQKDTFLIMSMDTLSTSLLWNMLAGKGVIEAGEGIIRAKQTC